MNTDFEGYKEILATGLQFPLSPRQSSSALPSLARSVFWEADALEPPPCSLSSSSWRTRPMEGSGQEESEVGVATRWLPPCKGARISDFALP